jgi:tRNA pseudouridine55 synthase
VPAEPGLIVLDKAAGLTSHGCVARVRRLADIRKVGHAGTLDPMATGVLLLGVGRATRFLTYLVGLDKRYTATIRLGQSTTTDDAEGQLSGGAPASGLPTSAVEAALAPLRGVIAQVPSAVSAVKVDGRRAYARARAGEEFELKPREVVVSRLEVLDRRTEGDLLDLDVIVHCSSGTYVRALARDLGAALGVGGHLTALRREAVGPFGLDGAVTLEGLARGFETMPLGAVARPLFPVALLSADEASRLANGGRARAATTANQDVLGAVLVDAGRAGELVAALGPDGALVAMARWEADGRLRPEAVFA